MSDQLKYILGLRFCDGIGNITARRLLSLFSSPESIFREKRKSFLTIPGTTDRLYNIIKKNVNWTAVEKELEFIQNNNVKWTTCFDQNYPDLLSSCYDAPFLIFYQGELNINNKKCISVVGTRSATEYGKKYCAELIENLKEFDPVIVSGLAYGIDITAHLSALDNDLTTVGIVAHGLNTIYPSAHKQTAKKITNQGCILTEFTSLDRPDKENFPKRNRIIAGISSATIVIEASEKGGALITARLANGYNRDVFAFPGRAMDKYSKGCNYLIKNNIAQLIESSEDLISLLGWEKQKTEKNKHYLTPNMSEEELIVIRLLEEKGNLPIDMFSDLLNFSPTKIASLLLSLELKGAIYSHPGKIYELC